MINSENLLILGANSDIALELVNIYSNKKDLNIFCGTRDEHKYFENLKNYNLNKSNKIKIFKFDINSYELDLKKFFDNKLFFNNIIIFSGILKFDPKNINEFELGVNTNFFNLSKCILFIGNEFKKKENYNLAFISSVAGEKLRKKNFTYSISKQAITNFAEMVNLNNLFENMNLITIKPGFVKTKMTSHLNLPALLTNTPLEIAKLIEKCLKNKVKIGIPWKWKIILLILKFIPNKIFKRLNL